MNTNSHTPVLPSAAGRESPAPVVALTPHFDARQVSALVALHLLAGLLLVAALSKLIAAYPLKAGLTGAGQFLPVFMPLWLAGSELCVAGFVFCTPRRTEAAGTLLAFTTAFLLYSIWHFFSGNPAGCHCFGGALESKLDFSGWHLVARNLLLFTVNLYTWRWFSGSPGPGLSRMSIHEKIPI